MTTIHGIGANRVNECRAMTAAVSGA